jgi:hypothetical protein
MNQLLLRLTNRFAEDKKIRRRMAREAVTLRWNCQIAKDLLDNQEQPARFPIKKAEQIANG